MTTYQINGASYNKSELTSALRDIVKGAEPNRELSLDLQDVITSIIAVSPNSDKLSDGVAGYLVKRHPMGQNCLHIIRPNGEVQDFSLNKLFTEPSPLARAKSACRTAAEPSIIEFRRKVDPYGTKVGFHVHHAQDWPFVRIADEFLIAHPTHSTKKEERNSRSVWVFEDERLSVKFREFHDEVAVLELIPAGLNLRLGAGGYKSILK